jgi:hypothetical protein
MIVMAADWACHLAKVINASKGLTSIPPTTAG